MISFINYPAWLTPEVFGFLNLSPDSFLNIIRWYAVSYILGLIISYKQSLYILKHDNLKTLNKKIAEDYYFWAILGLFLGGRIFSCLVYNLGYYSEHPLEILIPYRNGVFTGFSGMAYHGAAIGIFTASLLFARSRKINFRELCDMVFPVIPLGYTLGRIANFINQELWGRITSAQFGVLFPKANKVPLNLETTQNVIHNIGWQVDASTGIVVDKAGKAYDGLVGNIIDNGGNITNIPGINLPRHPSQLYEAFFEGIILFFLIWFIGRRFKPFKGFMAPFYLIGYSVFRFFLEFFREPDNEFANIASGKYTGFIAGNISMGQLLSIIMFFAAILLWVYYYYLDKKDKLK